MTESVLMLYGEYANEQGVVHPEREDMFRDPHDLQRMFHEQGVNYHIAVALDPPSGRRALGDVPRIRVARNPIYNEDGVLQQATEFEKGSLEDYPAVIDHWVANFQDRVAQPDGSSRRTAYGLGVPHDRIWNCRPIQDMGNRKDLMDQVIQEHGVGLSTYATSEIDALVEQYPDKRIIYKPIDGSRGKGIEVFDDPKSLKEALDIGRIAKSGFLQPYLNLRRPIQNLVPANQEAAARLRDVNFYHDRVREIRMHVLAYTDDFGSVQAEAYPTLKCSQLGAATMRIAGYVALAPESVSEETWNTSTQLARAVVAAAQSNSGENVTQFYGAFDWMIDSEGRTFVGDGNCRGPALAPQALAAREAFTRILADSARRNA